MDFGRNRTRITIKELDFSVIIKYNINMFKKEPIDIADLTIEDCLELVAGISNFKFSSNQVLKDLHSFTLHEDNHKIMFSIAKQVMRGTALTDKQHELVKKLLVEYYALQFNQHNIDIKNHLDKLRQPLRKLDSSHWVRIQEVTHRNITEQMLVIRFPFNKKVINRLEELKNGNDKDYFYEKHKHFFPLTEKYVWKVVNIANKFASKFEVSKEIQEIYNELKVMNDNVHKFLPGIKDHKFINYNDHGISICNNDLGEPNVNNLYQYFDRKGLYGLEYFNDIDVTNSFRSNNCSTLAINIANRSGVQVCIDDTKWNIDELGLALQQLDRFPLLVILDTQSCLDNLTKLHNAFVNFIPNQNMSVMFRLDTKDLDNAKEFNQFIHDKALNNYVDKDTKVVYISSNKVPKPLFKSEWKPIASLAITRQPLNLINEWINGIDLVMAYDAGTIVNPHNRWQVRVENI